MGRVWRECLLCWRQHNYDVGSWWCWVDCRTVRWCFGTAWEEQEIKRICCIKKWNYHLGHNKVKVFLNNMYHLSETIKKGREWRKKLMNNWEVKHNGLQEELSIVEQLSVGRSDEWYCNISGFHSNATVEWCVIVVFPHWCNNENKCLLTMKTKR
jgi:hypothetical protein